jgi:hypothetical protein
MSDFTGDMKDAVESAFSAASTPDVASTTTVESTAPSTTATATTDVTPAASETTTTQEPGPIPYTRFKEVNDKAGSLAKELETLAWAKGADPNLTRGAMDLITRARQNPLAFAEELETLKDHPVHGPALRSWAARTLGTRAASRPTETDVDAEPMPDLEFEDGRKAYSAERQQQREQWLQRQWDAKIDAKIEPLAKRGQATDEYVANQVYSGIKVQAETTAKTEIESLAKQYPQFNDHRKDVAAVMEANPSYTLKQAWSEVFVDKVGPQLASQQAASVTKKVQAGSANPARPSGAHTTAPGSIREHLELLMNS